MKGGDILIIRPQVVEVKWHSTNKNHYIKYGYKFTKFKDSLFINVDHLQNGSTIEVNVKCDNNNCNKIYKRIYSKIFNTEKHYCSQKCINESGKNNKYNKNDLIELFWKYYVEYGKYPLSVDFKNTKGFPNPNVFRKYFGNWNNYLKEVGVVDKNTNDGWYIHDEALLRRYYPDNKIDLILKAIMIKRNEAAIRAKALSIGLNVKKEIHYKSKFTTSEYIIRMKQDAINFFNEHGRSPYRSELNYPRRAFIINWDTYNHFLEECNLPLYRRQITIKNKQEGIELLLTIKKELKRTPTVNDLDDYGIHKNWYAKRFGSFRSALFEAGLISEEDYNIELKLEKTIEEFKKLYKINKSVPPYMEFVEYTSNNNLLSVNTLMDKTGLYPYTTLCRELLGESNVNDLEKDELLNMLINLKEKLKRVPMATEIQEYGLPSLSVYKTAFKVRYFNDIIKSLGWIPNGHDPKYRTDEELLDDLNKLYIKLNRIPYTSEFRDNEIADYSTYINRFGSIERIYDLLNIDYNAEEIKLKSGVGNKCYDYNGEMCKSINEMLISNILIDSNLLYIKEYPYKSVIDNVNNNINMDWYLNDFNLGVEFFGLFNEKYLDYDNWVGDYSRKTIEKIKIAVDNNFNLIDLYPCDLENNFKGLVDKFNHYGLKIIVSDDKKIAI